VVYALVINYRLRVWCLPSKVFIFLPSLRLPQSVIGIRNLLALQRRYYKEIGKMFFSMEIGGKPMLGHGRVGPIGLWLGCANRRFLAKIGILER
jgi:hypothetical protein